MFCVSKPWELMRNLNTHTHTQKEHSWKLLAVIFSTQMDIRSPKKNRRRDPWVSVGLTYWEPFELQLSNMEIQPQYNTQKKETLHTGIFSAAVLLSFRQQWRTRVTHTLSLIYDRGSQGAASHPPLLKTRLTESWAPFCHGTFMQRTARPRSPEASGFHIHADR